jgi:hypothetical protein
MSNSTESHWFYVVEHQLVRCPPRVHPDGEVWLSRRDWGTGREVWWCSELCGLYTRCPFGRTEYDEQRLDCAALFGADDPEIPEPEEDDE